MGSISSIKGSTISRRRMVGSVPGVLLAGTAGLAAVGCTAGQSSQPAPSPSQEAVTVNVLLDPSLNMRYTQMAPVIPTFETTFPKIKLNVEVTTNPGIESREKLKAKL